MGNSKRHLAAVLSAGLLVLAEGGWSGPRMRSVRMGSSPARHFLVGESDGPLWPLHFTGAGAAVNAPENLYTQVSLAAAEGVRLFSVELAMGSFIKHDGLWPAAVAMLQQVVALAPRGFVIIRASFDGQSTCISPTTTTTAGRRCLLANCRV